MQRVWSVLACLLVVAAIAPAKGFAHGGAPVPRAIAERIGAPGWVLETNFGFITAAQPERFICEESFLGGESFELGQLDAMTWVIATANGIARSEDGGCSYTRVFNSPEPAKALTVDPSRGWAVFLSQDQQLESPLWWSKDRGQSFQAVGAFKALEVGMKWTGASFVGERELLVLGYESDVLARGQARAWRVDLEADTLVEVAGLEGLKYPYLLAAAQGQIAGVAITDLGTVLWWDPLEQLGTTRIGVEFWPSAVSIDPDGQTLWVASSDPMTGGIRSLSRADVAQPGWRDVWVGQPVQCVLATKEQGVLACVDRAIAGADLVQIDLEGGAPTPLVNFEALTGPNQGCEASSQLAQTCPLVWDELARQLRLGPGEPDMGVSEEEDMSELAPADMGRAKPREEPTGCQGAGAFMPAQTPLSLGLGWLLLALMGRRGRRSRQ